MTTRDKVTVGLTSEAHQHLKRLKDDGIFGEMLDGYRFAIGLAVRKSLIADPDIKTETFVNVGSLDADGLIRDLIQLLHPAEAPYRLAERLAEAGVERLWDLHVAGQLEFQDFFADESD